MVLLGKPFKPEKINIDSCELIIAAADVYEKIASIAKAQGHTNKNF